MEEDYERAKGLLADEKERAEHVMLVDLARNDLGRVCEYGTVSVDELMAIESYSHVMHIVSSVAGTLREGVTAMDALRASLPAGTLSGAPKIRAMQIIDELEPVKRGAYGGAIGYLSYTGDLDTCIYIRSAVIKDGRIHVQAGGGIVARLPRPNTRSRDGGEGRGGGGRRGACVSAEGVGMSIGVRRRWPAAQPPANGPVIPRTSHASPADRQLRLLHLQPRPVPGRAWG